MDGGLARILIAAVPLMLLAWAAWGDLRTRTIPNWLCAAIALTAPLWWWAGGLPLWPDVPIQIGLAAGAFALFVIPFAMGAMGGGDVKLIGALALWLPLPWLMKMLVVMAVAGGVLTLAMLAMHRLRKAEGNPEIPYGVAIAFAGLWVIANDVLTTVGA
jgi:prepilin peptidase CpaA